MPGALAAVALALIVYLRSCQAWPYAARRLVRPAKHVDAIAWSPAAFLPEFAGHGLIGGKRFRDCLSKMPIILPFALATIVGGIDCTESAAAAGDEYDTRSILLTEGIASLAAGLPGGVIQTTPYIGHPAYKKMGGRAAYTLATALFIGRPADFGWFSLIVRLAARGGHVSDSGVRRPGNRAPSRSTPRHSGITRHLALAILPARGLSHDDRTSGPAFRFAPCIALPGKRIHRHEPALGFQFVGDSRPAHVSGQLFLLVAAACSLVGVIHSPLPHEAIAWPWDVVAQMPRQPSMSANRPIIGLAVTYWRPRCWRCWG